MTKKVLPLETKYLLPLCPFAFCPFAICTQHQAPNLTMFPQNVPEITVQELKALMDADQTPFILDVREEMEYGVANLNGTLIPLQQIPHRLDELDDHKDDLIVVHCRSGARSAQAVQFMRERGFEQAKNLRGGVLAWSREIDPSMPTY